MRDVFAIVFVPRYRIAGFLLFLFVLLGTPASHAQCFNDYPVFPNITISPQYWAPGQGYNVTVTVNPADFILNTPSNTYVMTESSYDSGLYTVEDPAVTVSGLTYVSPSTITFNAAVAAGASSEYDAWYLTLGATLLPLRPLLRAA